MANEFLHREYEQCFEHVRFYDQRETHLLKFLFTLSSASTVALFALYKLFDSLSKEFLLCMALLSFVVLVGSILIFLSMMQNRLYFVFMMRQINAIRGYLLNEEVPDFAENQLYTRTDFSAANPFSVHTFMLVGSALTTSLFAGSTAFALCHLSNAQGCWYYVVLAFVVLFLLLSIGGYFYLKTQSAKSADAAIHYGDGK